MNWLLFFVLLWALIVGLVGLFVYVDAVNAFDGDPKTHTLSGYIKHWRRKSRFRSVVLSAVIGSLFVVPTYLFFHLVLEVV